MLFQQHDIMTLHPTIHTYNDDLPRNYKNLKYSHMLEIWNPKTYILPSSYLLDLHYTFLLSSQL